jgi:glyoxylase-like metal-dependent hydrolase (beta-lactamase superfamily II)
LVDAGLKWSAPKIKNMVNDLFGADNKPSAVILTHGHFDHVGALSSLADEWKVPIYAHELEIPYLTGQSPYPPSDPFVGGGLMSSMSWMYPRGPIDIHEYVQALPSGGSIPGFPQWRYIHTPGHAPGHISLYREKDKILIAGDAFVTTKQESAIYALSYMKKLSGPPQYFTCDWQAAEHSVKKLANLQPEVVATGHGKPMRGEEMRTALHELAHNFEEQAIPSQGRYVNSPAITDRNGIVYVPPISLKNTYPALLKVLGISVAVLSIAYLLNNARNNNDKLLPSLKNLLPV